MRFEFDDDGYVCCILDGCFSGSCTEYEGLVPKEPEEYTDIDDWAERAKVQAYYLDGKGNLAYDAERAASIPDEDEIIITPYTSDQLKALGILDAIRNEIETTIFDAIYPVGSIYISTTEEGPQALFGGEWARIEDRFLLAAGSKYEVDTESAEGISSKVTVNIPAHKHLTPLVKSGDYLGFWTGGESTNLTRSNRIVAAGASYTNSASATTYYTTEDGACSTSVTVPPTLPPYMAVFVWKRIA